VISQKTFQETEDPKHPLHYLLPPVKVSNGKMVLWPKYPYQIPLSKSSSYEQNFISYIKEVLYCFRLGLLLFILLVLLL